MHISVIPRLKLKCKFPVSLIPFHPFISLHSISSRNTINFFSPFLYRHQTGLLYLSGPQKDIFIFIIRRFRNMFVHSRIARWTSPPPLAVRYIQSASASSPATSFTRLSQPFKEKQEYCQLQIDSMLKLFSNEEETSVFAYFLLLPPLHWHFRLVVAATTGRFISPAVCLLCFLSLLH